MIKTRKYFFCVIFLCLPVGIAVGQQRDARFVTYIANPSEIRFFWKDTSGQAFRSIQNFKLSIEKEGNELAFAMNGGMYTKDNSPQGLYIENTMIFSPLDTTSGSGNFYLKPNGVFYITSANTSAICKTTDLANDVQIKFATQSGPMLLIDGAVHPAFKKGSANLNIRNGVGILPDNRVIFAMSKKEINFYDFAEYFKSMNCKNALYLDGFVSRMYLPAENWIQLDGNFGVIIGVLK